MLISIITINYNNLEGLKKTVNSVFEQSYKDIEYIIIDGDSNDGSKDYLQSQESEFAYYSSEPDKGIYDAMNKGIGQVKGDYVLFLNSGDTFYNTSVIHDFVKQTPVEEIVYGDAMLIYKDKEPVRKHMPKDLGGTTLFTKTVTHQAMFHKAGVFKNARYDLRFTMIADWVFYNTVVLLNKGTYRHIDAVIANYDMSGLSSDTENATVITQEREVFYKEHATFFTPLLDEHKALTLKRINESKKPSMIRLILKGLRKFKLYK